MTRYRTYDAFKEWFEASRDSCDIPPYKELARQYSVSVSCINKWVRGLGGFKHRGQHRRSIAKVEAAIEYMKSCTIPIGLKGLMTAVGYTSDSSTGASVIFLRELKARSPSAFAKLKSHARDVNDDTELILWGRRFKRRNKRPPTIREVAQRLGRSVDYTYSRVRAIINAYPDAPFMIGKEITAIVADCEFEKRARKGSRQGYAHWRRIISKGKWLGFDFKGEFWERYQLMWRLRRRGYQWSGDPAGALEAGQAKKLRSYEYCSIEEALSQDIIQ